jgi:hypothetical protein
MNDDLDNFDGPVPLFPLPNAVLFPQIVLPFHIFEPRYVEMVNDTLEDRHLIGMTLLKPGWEVETQDRPAIHPIGCAGRIGDLTKLPDGRFNLSLFGLRRFRIEEEMPTSPYRTARVAWLPDSDEGADTEVGSGAIQEIVRLLNSVPQIFENEMINGAAFPAGEQFARSVHALAIRSHLFPAELQTLLELGGPLARATQLSRILATRVAVRRSAERSKKYAPEDPGVN